MKLFGAHLFLMGALCALIGCSVQQGTLPVHGWGTAVPAPSVTASPGQATWACTMQINTPMGTYNGPGTCGLGTAPGGAAICQVTEPNGGNAQGWCLPTAGSSPAPATPVPTPIATPTPIPPQQTPVPATSMPPSTTSSSAPSSHMFLTLNVGQTQQINLSANGTAATGSYTASSSNANVATISPATGPGPFFISAKSSGSATITLVDGNGNTLAIYLTVN